MYKFYSKMQWLKEHMTLKREQGVYVGDIDERLCEIARKYMTKLENIKSPESFPYDEPETLQTIKEKSPPNKPQVSLYAYNQEDYYNRILGGWLGRSSGCALGIPVEGWSKERICEWAKKLNQHPLKDYWKQIPFNSVHYEGTVDNFLRGQMRFMGSDDDLAYTILALHVLEEYGPGFSTEDIANEWIDHLPIACTAEKVALNNLEEGIPPGKSGKVNNPFSEWIGAYIRADMWGYVCPGHPELAADMAYRDAIISHTRNGVYSEIFFSAVIAGAFVNKDLNKLFDVGLAYIPASCRFSEAVQNVRQWCEQEEFDWEKVFANIERKYGHYNGAHAINNAAICIMALLCSNSFSEAIGIAVSSGWDADCNGATVGSIWGVMNGANAIPEKWIRDFNDTLKSYVIGFEECSFTDLASRTVKQGLRIYKSD